MEKRKWGHEEDGVNEREIQQFFQVGALKIQSLNKYRMQKKELQGFQKETSKVWGELTRDEMWKEFVDDKINYCKKAKKDTKLSLKYKQDRL